jgi:hypothetical protein
MSSYYKVLKLTKSIYSIRSQNSNYLWSWGRKYWGGDAGNVLSLSLDACSWVCSVPKNVLNCTFMMCTLLLYPDYNLKSIQNKSLGSRWDNPTYCLTEGM